MTLSRGSLARLAFPETRGRPPLPNSRLHNVDIPSTLVDFIIPNRQLVPLWTVCLPASSVQPASDTPQVTPPSPDTTQEFNALERVSPGGGHPVSRFAPGILVEFGRDGGALQFVYGRLSTPTLDVLHHVSFPKTLSEPWKWMGGAWHFFMDECPGVPLDTVIDRMSSTELDSR